MLLLTTLDSWRAGPGPRFVLSEAGAVWAPEDDPGLLAVADDVFAEGQVVAVTLDPEPGAVPGHGVIDQTAAARVRYLRRGPDGRHVAVLDRPATAAALGLLPHPEGGWYRETSRSAVPLTPDGYPGERASATGIYFSLPPGEESMWHAVRSAEVWLWHRGGPLTLLLGGDSEGPSATPETVLLGDGLADGQVPQAVVPPGVGLAARMCHRPLVVHEQTVRLGLTNRTLARVATRVAVSSESTLPLLPRSARKGAVVTGNPVRPELLAGDLHQAVAALGLQGFDISLPTVYITGGAQGSQQINGLVTDILPWLLSQANVVHQCGPANLDDLRAQLARMPLAADQAGRYFLTPYVTAELPDVLALADIVISRSGAGTIAELTALGKAAVLVPLASSAGNEQVHNARHLEQIGAAIALVDDVRPDRLGAAIAPLLTDVSRRADMAKQAQAHGRPEAAARLVEVILAAAAN